MANSDSPQIEKGYVYQDKKRPERKLSVIDAEVSAAGTLKLQNEKTSAVREMAPETLAAKFKLIGRYLQVDGKLKFVATDRVNDSQPKPDEKVAAAEARARLDSLVLDLTREALLTDKFERVSVLKAKVQCPCGDVHEVKEESFPDFITSIARMCVRHDACHKTNVLPGLHEDRIDTKKKPANGEAHA